MIYSGFSQHKTYKILFTGKSPYTQNGKTYTFDIKVLDETSDGHHINIYLSDGKIIENKWYTKRQLNNLFREDHWRLLPYEHFEKGLFEI